jgi:hypothetical protein
MFLCGTDGMFIVHYLGGSGFEGLTAKGESEVVPLPYRIKRALVYVLKYLFLAAGYLLTFVHFSFGRDPFCLLNCSSIMLNFMNAF